MATAVVGLLWLLLGVSCLYQWLCYHLLERFRRHELEAPAPFRPEFPVSHLKPLLGLQSASEANWRSVLDQSYLGPVETVFTLGSQGDPASALAHQLARQYPSVRVVEGEVAGMGCNRKVANLLQGLEHCHYPWIACSDADTALPPDYMDKVMALFDDPQVGMVTSLYCIRCVTSGPLALEALAIVDFSTSVLVARALEGVRFGLGATIVLRRQALESIGGFSPLLDYLAEDYQLGARIAAAGWKVKLSGVVVEDVPENLGFGDYLAHQLRWMRSYRISRPAGYFAFIVTQGTLWSTLLALVYGWTTPGCLALVLWWGFRVHCTRANWQILGGVNLWHWWPWLVLKDTLYLLLWLLSWGGNRVRWGSRRLQLLPDGRMRELP